MRTCGGNVCRSIQVSTIIKEDRQHWEMCKPSPETNTHADFFKVLIHLGTVITTWVCQSKCVPTLGTCAWHPRWDTPEEQEARGQAGKPSPEQKAGRQQSCREVCVHGPGYPWLGAGSPNMPGSWIYQISQLSLPSPLLFPGEAREHSACKPHCFAFQFVEKALFV